MEMKAGREIEPGGRSCSADDQLQLSIGYGGNPNYPVHHQKKKMKISANSDKTSDGSDKICSNLAINGADFDKISANHDKIIANYDRVIADNNRANANHERANANRERANANHDRIDANYDMMSVNYDRVNANQNRGIAYQDRVNANQNRGVANQDRGSGNHTRVCRFCHREFPSGRALGGHMRIHGALANPESSVSKPDISQSDLMGNGLKEMVRLDQEAAMSNMNQNRVLSKHITLDEVELLLRQRDEGNFPNRNTDGNGVFRLKKLDESVSDDVDENRALKVNGIQFNGDEDEEEDGDFLKFPWKLHQQQQQQQPIWCLGGGPALNLGVQQPLSSVSLALSDCPKARSCSECGKIFWSMKALSGHMRCHPEREWRGIQKPESSLSESGKAETETDTDVDVGHGTTTEPQKDLKKSDAAGSTISTPDKLVISTPMIKDENGERLIEEEIEGKPGRAQDLQDKEGSDELNQLIWPTRKRTRRSRSNSGKGPQVSSSSASQDTDHITNASEKCTTSEMKEDEDMDMANCLVLLAGATAGSKINATRDSSAQSRNAEDAETSDMSANLTNPNARDEKDEDVSDDDTNEVKMTSAGVRYECSTCKRRFNSHQALGGHRASHRKTKGCFARASNAVEEVHESGEDVNTSFRFSFGSGLSRPDQQRMRHGLDRNRDKEERIPTQFLSKKPKGHECSICHRIFPSGQALGGHKRCHWTGEKTTEASVSVTLSSNASKNQNLQEQAEVDGGGGGSIDKPANNGIDLNLPAPEENEILEELDDAVGRVSEGQSKDDKPIVSDGRDGVMFNGLHPRRDWMKKDVVQDEAGGSKLAWMSQSRVRSELENRCRFDHGRSSNWSQPWPKASPVAAAAQFPQVCAMQPL